MHRRLAIGAEVQTEAGAHFRVWAPRRQKVEVVFPAIAQQAELPSVLLDRESDGYFSGFSSEASDGTRYAFRLDDSERLYPDPASRRQPDGPHAPSQIVDPTRFQWTDREWRGVELKGQVIYELHVGTFTREG
ncbi:MAG TPA: malto-oligosyltrehalose trehalohydrolase, partial [Pirellulales bacterium]|nr:malto-oligosyltrehalose trehalohydrolase [Pirellulales bacterium]